MNNIGKFLGGVLVLVALVVGIAFGSGSHSTPSQQNVSGTPSEQRVWYPNGIALGASPHAVAEQWAVKDLGDSADQVVVLSNTKTYDMIVDYGELQLVANAAGTETASTTYKVQLFATSTATVPNTQDYTALAADKYQLINATNWATSTTATTTNSVGNVVGGGQGSIRLPSGWSLIAYMQNLATGGGGAGCNGATCETATSTNRGFDIRARVHFHWDDTTVR